MKKYKVLQKHYEQCLSLYGPTSKGMDWPNENDLEKRFTTLTEFINVNNTTKVKVLDLGCGVGLLLNFFSNNQLLSFIDYKGIDISSDMIATASSIHPEFKFEQRDILENDLEENSYDYIIMNGLFTEKRELTQEEMMSFFKEMILRVYKAARIGISFNVISSHVDWKRDDLFHLELDRLVSFLVEKCSRRIKINMDYGLYEYSVYLMK